MSNYRKPRSQDYRVNDRSQVQVACDKNRNTSVGPHLFLF